MQQFISKVAEIKLSYSPLEPVKSRPRITSFVDAYRHFLNLLTPENLNIKEEAAVLFLTRSNQVLGGYRVSSGGITGTVMDPRIILAIALKSLSTGFIITHTHPSGSLVPSEADCELTIRMGKAAKLMDISLLDHLIITQDGYMSMADQGLL